MLHGLAGLIFGKGGPSSEVLESTTIPAGQVENESKNEIQQNAISQASKPAIGSQAKSESLEIVDGVEDEWLMVDVKRDEHMSTELAAAMMMAPMELDLALPSSVEASSGESSPSVGERGWNLTPPPCFTASFQREKRGLDAKLPTAAVDAKKAFGKTKGGEYQGDEEALNTVLETSNFENLLIEHPSMSVYGRITAHEAPRRSNAAQGIDQTKKTVATAQPPTPLKSIKEKGTTVDTVVNQPQRRQLPNVAEMLLYGDEFSMTSSRRVDAVDLGKQQRSERAYKAKDMGANRTRRMNAIATLVPAQGSASPRKRRMKNHPAGRCNDRKCQ